MTATRDELRQTPGVTRPSSRRAAVVWLLIVLSSILVAFATLAVALEQLLLNTDRWSAAVTPLAANSTVQSSVAQTAASLTLNALDLQDRVQSLPAPLRSLAGPVEAMIATFVDDQSIGLVQSSQFQDLWRELNRTGHQAIVDLLRGENPGDGAIVIDNGEVDLNLLALVPPLLERLGQAAPDLQLGGQALAGSASGQAPLSRLQQLIAGAVGHQLPPDAGYVTLLSADSLAEARRAVQLLDRLTWLSVAAAVVSVVATVLVSAERRLTTLRLGIGVALGTVVASLGLIVAQTRMLSALAGRPISGAVQVALAAVLANIGQVLLVEFVVAVVVVLLAFVAGRMSTPKEPVLR